MIASEEWMDIKLLAAQGHSIRAIVKLTGRSRNTVRRALRQKTPAPFATPERGSKLDPFKPYLTDRFEKVGLSAVRLLEEVRAQGYTGSVYTLRRFLRCLTAPQRLHATATIRFETPPGQQAQVDWTYCGRFPNQAGTMVPIYGFACVLGFSRMLFCCFTTSMKLADLLECHLQAFAYLGGCTRSILYDNMKQVRLDRARLNPVFVDFAAYYGFTPSTHRVRRPRTKGKVERTMAYIKDSFLAGRSFADLDDLNAQARHWLDTCANVRVHGTTRQRPVDLLPAETLLATSHMPAYAIADKALRTVSREGMVQFRRSRYSVPPEHVGRSVLVEHLGGTIRVRSQDLILAEHEVAQKPGSCVVDPAHIEAMCKLTLAPEAPRLPRWTVRFDQGVQTRPLSEYEEVAQ